MPGDVKATGSGNVSHAAIEALRLAIVSGCLGAGNVVLYTRWLAQRVQPMVAAVRGWYASQRWRLVHGRSGSDAHVACRLQFTTFRD